MQGAKIFWCRFKHERLRKQIFALKHPDGASCLIMKSKNIK